MTIAPDTQAALALKQALMPTDDRAWVLHEDGFDALREASVESRFAISNGFLGVRGARAITRGARWVVPPRTYVAGLFDTPGTGPDALGLVPAADWLQIRILLPSGPLVHHPSDVASHRMTLDMKRGVLLAESRGLRLQSATDPKLGIHARTARLVSLGERGIGLQLVRLEIEDGASEITLEASFEGLDLALVSDRLEDCLGVWHTHRPGKRLAMATSATLEVDGKELAPTSAGPLTARWTWTCRPGQIVGFQRLVAVVRADIAAQDPVAGVTATLTKARQLGWHGVLAEHENAWARRWQRSDVEVEGDPSAQRALRFALYHLNGAANPADERVSIGARALTGDDYRGHVFWDTEIYLLPFYTMTWPEAARAMLMYRFRTLDCARAKARGMGWRGALYAWESADTGEETTLRHVVAPDRKIIDVLCGTQEQHISADVAYAVWQYWRATADEGFLLDAGAEILLETGRFWASRAGMESDGHCHIRGVIGPDEYHEHIDDNAFTNVMARWNIRRALEVAALLRQRWPACWTSLAARLAVDDAELIAWSHTAEAMETGLDSATGLFEQFTGFNHLEHIDLEKYADRSVPMDVVLGRDRTQRSQVVKQADVVALLGLLPDEFPGTMAATNFDHYEPRCSHGSSLSRAMHGFVAARLGLSDLALRYFRQTSEIDLDDTRAAADGGIHIAALGGIWMTAVFGFAGVALMEEGIALDPKLPPGWTGLAFPLQWRGRRLQIRLGRHDGYVTLIDGAPMTVVFRGRRQEVRPGREMPLG